MDGWLDHTMMRVEDLEESLAWYTGNLDYVEYGRREGDDFTNVYLAPPEKPRAEAMLELTYNHDGRSYDMGDGWGHIAVRVDDLEARYEELLDNGVPDYRSPASCGGNYAFVRDPDGHEIELVSREHGSPWGLDHTMIRVEDPDAAIGWFVRKFEYDHTRRWEADTFTNYFLQPADAGREATAIELTYNHDDRSYDLGDAWGHLAVRCADLEGFWSTLVMRGAPEYRPPESCGFEYAFTRHSEGHEVEVIAREG